MDRLAIDIAEAVARLSALTIFELRNEWRRLHRMAPPMRLSRDLLIRAIAYKLQERAYGGLSKTVARKLEQANADPSNRDEAKPAPPISLKPGTRLVREWRGDDPHGPRPCRRRRMARSTLPFPLGGRARDHRRALVRPALLRPQTKAASVRLPIQ